MNPSRHPRKERLAVRLPILLLVATLCTSAAAADPVPFPVDWRETADSPASLAFLLDAPAGRTGFTQVINGHLARGDGLRLRLWGINVSSTAGLPPREDAPLIAAHLAQRGINAVRFHFFDQPAPRGILDPARNDTAALDAAAMDRLDFFVAELKSRGIYSDINLNVARRYKPGDEVRDADALGMAKAATYFNPRLLELQRDYARKLLTHVNAYTKNEYRNEPAVALVEMVNENSIVESWFSDRLLGKQEGKATGTWHDLPPSYAQELTDLYNAWLPGHVPADQLARIRATANVAEGQPLPRLTAKQFASADAARFHAEASFYMDLERRYFHDMGEFLKNDLKVHALLLGTSDHNHGKTGYPLLSSTSQLDVVDGHVYWQHPHYIESAGKRQGFDIPNTAMVDDPLHSTVVQLARSAVAGKPYVVSEVNHPFPAEHASEGIPILAAYACLQDWDGLFWYTLGHGDVAAAGPEGKPAEFFDLAPDPVKMAELSAGALTFLRADVQPARQTIARAYTAEQVRESIRTRAPGPFFTPDFPQWTPLVHSTRISSLDAPAACFDSTSEVTDPWRSDTGELFWSAPAKGQGCVTIDTDRTQALIGHLKATKPTRHLLSQLDNDFAAVTLSSVDAQPIARATRLLLTVGGTVSNTAMQWNDKRTTLESWGKPPVRIEPITGTIALRGLDAATEVTATPLDGACRPLAAPPVSAEKSAEGAWSLKVGQSPTVWYIISVNR
jgi:hypothetical protein